MRGLLQKQPARLRRVAVPAVVVHAAVGHVVDRLHHGQPPQTAAARQLLHLQRDGGKAKREAHHHALFLSPARLAQRLVLLAADTHGLFQKQRHARFQHPAGQRRMQRAARADEHAVQIVAGQQRCRVLIPACFGKVGVVLRSRRDLCVPRIGHGGHADVRFQRAESLEHGFGAKAVADKADSFHRKSPLFRLRFFHNI